MKSQNVRIADVLLLGPFMIYLGAKRSRMNQGEKLALVGLGIATILYNWKNYREIAAQESGAAVL